MPIEIQPAAEFQALPLEFIVASPLIAAVKAQAAAAEATKNFILSLMKDENGQHTPITVDFKVKCDAGEASKEVQVNAPLLSIVPVPHLRIDSLTTHFKYEISQTVVDSQKRDLSVSLEANTGAALSPFVNATLRGSVANASSESSTANRSGSLEITVHASEAPIPEGLAKILSLLSNSIQTKQESSTQS